MSAARQSDEESDREAVARRRGWAWLLAAYTCVVALAWSAGGDAMGRAAVLAAAVCLAAAVLAEALGRLAPAGPSQVVARYLLGMAVRMGLPLAAVVAVVVQRGPLYHSGAVVFLGLFYLMALAAEIGVSARSSSAIGVLGRK